MALPRQAAQTAAALGATSALRKPEPEPSPGPEALQILPEISQPRGNHGARCPYAPGRGSWPQPAPHGTHAVPSPGQGSAGWLWGWWHGRSRLTVQGQVLEALGGVPPSKTFLASCSPELHLLRTPGWEWRGGAGWGVQMKPDPNPTEMELCTIPVS